MKDNGGNKMKFYETTLNIEFQKRLKSEPIMAMKR